MRLRDAFCAAAMAALLAAPAMAHEGPPRGQGHGGGHPGGVMTPPPGPQWQGGWQQPWAGGAPMQAYSGPPMAHDAPPPQDREEWLRECRRRLGDNGVGGAVIGAVTGGVLGNAIGGRGNRVLGTVAGAAVGAVAGSAIDKAEDRARNADRCEAMLAAPPQPAPGYGAMPAYGYAPYGYMMVPVMMVPVQQPARGECKETVTTTEYVTYETRRSRSIPRRVPTKRVKIAPDKRVPK